MTSTELVDELHYPIPGHPGYYITTSGEVWSYKRRSAKLLSQRMFEGFRVVSLTRGTADSSVQYPVYRLLGEAFIPNPNGYKCVGHKNLDVQDDRLENLYWCEKRVIGRRKARRDIRDGSTNLSIRDVRDIRGQYEDGIDTAEIADDYGIPRTQALAVATRRAYGWVKS